MVIGNIPVATPTACPSLPQDWCHYQSWGKLARWVVTVVAPCTSRGRAGFSMNAAFADTIVLSRWSVRL